MALIAPPAAAAIARAAAPAAMAALLRRLRSPSASATGQVSLVWISFCSGCTGRPARASARRVTSLPRHRTLSSRPQAASRMVQLASSAETRRFMLNYSSRHAESRIPRSELITPMTGVMQPARRLGGGLLGLGSGLRGLRLRKDQLAVGRVDLDGVAL